MSLPTPAALGMPEHISAWRPRQEDGLHFLTTSTKRVKAICAPTGSGKCFGRGVPILRFDGSVIPVEGIKTGDLLMGPDSTPRYVTSIATGVGPLYSVTPRKGDPYVVNQEHILCLKMSGGSKHSTGIEAGTLQDVTVTSYLASTPTFRHCAKGYRSSVEFPSSPVPLDPYFLGLWLGDGTSLSTTIHTEDYEVVDYLHDLAIALKLRLHSEKTSQAKTCRAYSLRNPQRNRWIKNPILDALRELGVTPNKKMPAGYLINSREVRLSLLAGLLDTDGSLGQGGFDFISITKSLAHGVAYLCRSLGLAAYVSICEKSDQHGAFGFYYRVSISGHVDTIPTRIKRKKAPPRRQKKDVLVTGLRVEYCGYGEYFGFTLSGPDRRFLLGDFTVAHNSDLAVGDALRHPNEPTCIVTDSRALQDQYLKRYASIGMVDIRGRANYDCLVKPDDPTYTCEQGFAARCPYKGQVHCPASQAEMRAACSGLVITNYSKWIHARKFSQGLSHIKRVVFDEAHEMPNALAAAMQVVLHAREIEETLGLTFPNYHDAHFFSTWRPWAAEARANCEAQMVAARPRLGEPNVKASYVKYYTHLRHLSRRLSILATAAVDNWVVEELPRGYQFDPIQPARYAESALLLKVPEIICMSATLRPKTLFLSGIGRANFDFTEFLSDFDPARCPIYYTPTMRVDAKATSLAPLWVKLDQIAARRRDRNGLVHTISYTRRDEVLSQSRFATSMLINEKGEPPTRMIEEFIESYPGGILVSPSIGQGFDFPMTAAEWQFICKVPFPPPSKVLQAREEKDPEVPYYLAMQRLVQAAGRLMRDKPDQGETFIGDDHLVWFLKAYGHLAPQSFNQFFRRVDVLPSPPPRLGRV